MAQDAFTHLAALSRQLRDALQAYLAAAPSGSPWREHQVWFAARTGSSDRDTFADAVAQGVTCGCFGLLCSEPRLDHTRAITWLQAQTQPLVRDVLALCGEQEQAVDQPLPLVTAAREIRRQMPPDHIASWMRELPAAQTGLDVSVYFYERFLALYDRAARRRQGVFYTPPALVSFMVRGVDTLLRDEFQLADGFADTASPSATGDVAGSSKPAFARDGEIPYVRVLDPAMGTGVFLLQAAAVAEQRFRDAMLPATCTTTQAQTLWDTFVTRHLLPRLCGQELMLPPLILAHVALARWLAGTGFRFQLPTQLQLQLANTLAPPAETRERPEPATAPFTVILGNPPFAGFSNNRYTWMRNLLRGRDPARGGPVANYFSSAGESLRERKHWLEDDYVRFVRYAHWQIERAGSGIVAFVTNHAYLDNTTFRGMREQIAHTFPHITVVDLHGNTRANPRGPDGQPDQSVFGIEQGVAISFLRRPLVGSPRPRIRHAELWGDRDDKLKTLQGHDVASLPHTELEPASPDFFFVPRRHPVRGEYETGCRLCEIMPLNSTAVVTARDKFVVDLDAAALRQRMREFADLTISDADIRERYFRRSRSPLYPPGDTRGWRLAEARQQACQDSQWLRRIRTCHYRPWDRRSIIWAAWMIDWPRTAVMNQMLPGSNLALVARRQSPASQPCSYFWVTDCIAVDGLIRSDNRGSESIFPLYATHEHGQSVSLARGTRDSPSAPSSCQPNFSDRFIDLCTSRTGLNWQPCSLVGSPRDLTPGDLFHYIYALFHAPGYRERYAAQLRVDFPRVLVTDQPNLLRVMAAAGRQLVQWHLLPAVPTSRFTPAWNEFDSSVADTRICRGYPRYRADTISINPHMHLSPVSPSVWDFRVGAYQVCRKWLLDRRERSLCEQELWEYAAIVQAIAQTIRVMREIEEHIANHGGWEVAFPH